MSRSMFACWFAAGVLLFGGPPALLLHRAWVRCSAAVSPAPPTVSATLPTTAAAPPTTAQAPPTSTSHSGVVRLVWQGMGDDNLLLGYAENLTGGPLYGARLLIPDERISLLPAGGTASRTDYTAVPLSATEQLHSQVGDWIYSHPVPTGVLAAGEAVRIQAPGRFEALPACRVMGRRWTGRYWEEYEVPCSAEVRP